MIRCFLKSLHVVIAKTEMVADFVDQHMSDDVAKCFFILGRIVEDGAAIERNAVRTFSGLRIPAFGDAAALKKTKQIEGRFKCEVVHDLVGREFRELNDNFAGKRAEFLWQMGIGLKRQKLHLLN